MIMTYLLVAAPSARSSVAPVISSVVLTSTRAVTSTGSVVVVATTASGPTVPATVVVRTE